MFFVSVLVPGCGGDCGPQVTELEDEAQLWNSPGGCWKLQESGVEDFRALGIRIINPKPRKAGSWFSEPEDLKHPVLSQRSIVW